MPLSQVGTVNVPEPRMISVQVWDRSLVSAVERAIRDAGLGVNPMSDGHIRLIDEALAQKEKEILHV